MKNKLYVLSLLIVILLTSGCAVRMSLSDTIKMGDINRVKAIISGDWSKLDQSNDIGRTPIHVEKLL